MAVGDVVNAIGAAGRLTYQPAAGVEVLVTSVFHHNGAYQEISLIDASANQCYVEDPSFYSSLNVKIAINNTIWFTTLATPYQGGFTGFQTK
jgi:hypothetical protein